MLQGLVFSLLAGLATGVGGLAILLIGKVGRNILDLVWKRSFRHDACGLIRVVYSKGHGIGGIRGLKERYILKGTQ
jgi:hypothetical protein